MIPLGVLASARVAAVASSGGFTYEGYAQRTSITASSFTFTDVPLGAPAADRVIVAAIGRRISNGSNITGVTIGGVSATLDKASPTWSTASLWRATVPDGTTGDVVVTLTSNEQNAGYVFIYRATGTVSVASSNAAYLPAGGSTTTSVSPASAGAHLIAVAHTSKANGTWGWTGPTEDGDYTFPSTLSTASAASLTALPAGSTSITAAPSVNGSNSFQGLAAVSYSLT